jgi:hypothetical protein
MDKNLKLMRLNSTIVAYYTSGICSHKAQAYSIGQAFKALSVKNFPVTIQYFLCKKNSANE